jgi:hypothetical protein
VNEPRPSLTPVVGFALPQGEMLLPDGTKVLVTHWARREGPGPWRLACMPGYGPLDGPTLGRLAPLRYSDDPRAANCVLCRETEAYRRAASALGVRLP